MELSASGVWNCVVFGVFCVVTGLLPGCEVLGMKRETSSSSSPSPARVERAESVDVAGEPWVLCESSIAFTLLVVAGEGWVLLILLKRGMVGFGCSLAPCRGLLGTCETFGGCCFCCVVGCCCGGCNCCRSCSCMGCEVGPVRIGRFTLLFTGLRASEIISGLYQNLRHDLSVFSV